MTTQLQSSGSTLESTTITGTRSERNANATSWFISVPSRMMPAQSDTRRSLICCSSVSCWA